MPDLAQLSDQKRQLLAALLAGKSPAPAGPDAIPRRGGSGPAPLSLAQEQVWLHSQLVGGQPVYNEAMTVHRRGGLDAALLERCLRGVIERHEILRTTFAARGGEVVQLVHADAPGFVLRVVDLRHLPAAGRQAAALDLAAADAQRPLDLEAGPLLRALLLHLDDEEHRLHLTFHQIIFDGVSAYRVLLPELTALYEAFARGQPPPLPELPIQYADFAVWQRQERVQRGRAEHLAYWRAQLEGELPVLAWPCDHPRPAVESHRGAIERFALAEEVVAPLRRLARQQGVSLYAVLLAAFATLLHRYTGQDDIVLGGLTAARAQPEIEPLFGYFVNPLALRLDLAGDPGFSALAARVQGVVLDALAHEALPFAEVVRALHPKPDPSRSPMFQIIFSLQPQPPRLTSGWNLATEEVSNGASKMDMVFVLDDRGDGIFGPITYNPDLFEAATVRQMLTHYQALLRGIAAAPDQAVSALPILPELERAQMLVEWNRTERAYPDTCLHRLIEDQVARTPDRVALTFAGSELSYQELNARANALAWRLRALGVGPEALVGVCAERSLEMVVALLAVLKAGGAYVPIDPGYPAERVAFMLQDSGVPVLLAQRGLAEGLPPHRAQLVCLDEAGGALGAGAGGNPPGGATPENLAYMIYTSGSTGQPKGALNTHRGICNRLLWMQEQFGLGADDVVMQKTPFSFDVSVWEFFWPLLAGARLVLAQPGGHRDPGYLARLIVEQQVSVLHFVPSMLEAFLAHPGAGACRSLRDVMCSGEALPHTLRERFFQCLPARLHNLYGPTEAAVDVTHWACQRGPDRPIVPIGRPVANTQIYILDGRLRPVPVGVPGELHIGGVQVGRGYHRQPELTANTFVPDPFSPAAGARLYKTGDLCRWLADGTVEYLGRLDQQVKLRGFRIELGEIESALRAHGRVRDAAVALRGEGERQLVAYVVLTGASEGAAAELRVFLRQTLPEHMVPAAWVVLAALPLSPNGKLDRRALPAPSAASRAQAVPWVAPRTELEFNLARIWCDLLGRQGVGIHDDFFDLGGHSLLAARVCARVEAELGTPVALVTLFQAPTIAALAAVLTHPSRPSAVPGIVEIDGAGSRPPLFWVGATPRYRALAQRLALDQPFLGVHLDPAAIRQLRLPYGLEEAACHIVAAIRAVQPEGPYYLAGYCLNGTLAYEAAAQLEQQGQRVAVLVMLDAPNLTRSWPGRARQLLRPWAQFHLANVRQLSPRELWSYCCKRLRWLGQTIGSRLHLAACGRRSADADQLANPDDILEIAVRRYLPRPYGGQIAFLRTTQVPQGEFWDLAAGWREAAGRGLEVYDLPGDHESVFFGQELECLIGALKVCLRAAQSALRVA